MCKIPADTWAKISIVCPLGTVADGTYTLEVDVSGEKPQQFESLTTVSAAFKKLDWFGFVSDTTKTMGVYIDDVKVVTQ